MLLGKTAVRFPIKLALRGPLLLSISSIPLCNRCAAVVSEPLDKGNVIAVLLVYLCGVPFPKAMGADALISKVVTNKGKLFLYGSCGQGKHQLIAACAVAQTKLQ